MDFDLVMEIIGIFAPHTISLIKEKVAGRKLNLQELNVMLTAALIEQNTKNTQVLGDVSASMTSICECIKGVDEGLVILLKRTEKLQKA